MKTPPRSCYPSCGTCGYIFSAFHPCPPNFCSQECEDAGKRWKIEKPRKEQPNVRPYRDYWEPGEGDMPALEGVKRIKAGGKKYEA